MSYLKKVIEKVLKTTDSYSAILKNRQQKTLDTVIRENQSAAIKQNRTILYTLSAIRGIIDVSNKLNKNLSVISLNFLKASEIVDWEFVFSALPKFGYWDKFIHMIKVAFTNI